MKADFVSDRPQLVHCTTKEKMLPECLQQTVNHAPDSHGVGDFVIQWSWPHYFHPRNDECHPIHGCCLTCLPKPIGWDLAPCHATNPVTFCKIVIRVLDCPGKSPNLNPAENLWHIVNCKITNRSTQHNETDETFFRLWYQKFPLKPDQGGYKAKGRLL